MKKEKNIKKYVSKKYAKNNEYLAVLTEIEKEGKCPFCHENFKYHKHPILKKYGDWFITKISWPYKNTANHLILICKTHKEKFEDLTDIDFRKILGLVKWAIHKFKIKGGALALRFGDSNYTGATVTHLHAHLIVPLKSKTVQFPIG